MWRCLALTVFAAGVSLGSLAGCDDWGADIYTCAEPQKGRVDPKTGKPDPCPEGCTGQCVQLGASPWSRFPSLLWIGKGDPPACPARAPTLGFQGFADPVGTLACDACACERPTGTCSFPTTLTANSEACPADGPGVTHTSFDAPTSWAGGCTSSNPIPMGKQCGSGPCVKSITIDPPAIQETGCAVAVQPVPKLNPGGVTFKTHARECLGNPLPEEGCGQGEACMPTAEPPPPGFHQCIAREGDEADCPGSYPERFVFYEKYEDQRGCTPCSCGAATGSICETRIALYNATDCGAPPVVLAQSSIASGPLCADLPPGMGLLSKAGLSREYIPGTCEPLGGEPMGEVVMRVATTFRCQPQGRHAGCQSLGRGIRGPRAAASYFR